MANQKITILTKWAYSENFFPMDPPLHGLDFRKKGEIEKEKFASHQKFSPTSCKS